MTVRGINKVIIIGYLGQAPEIRYMPNGGAVANLSVATSDTWRDKQTGETREKTEWHRVVVFGNLADIAGEYLQKVAQIYIEGQLRTRSWQDDSNVTRYVTEIVVSQSGTMQMLGGRRDGGQSQTRLRSSPLNSKPRHNPLVPRQNQQKQRAVKKAVRALHPLSQRRSRHHRTTRRWMIFHSDQQAEYTP